MHTINFGWFIRSSISVLLGIGHQFNLYTLTYESNNQRHLHIKYTYTIQIHNV